jgi:CheY-like chemotaxis protein
MRRTSRKCPVCVIENDDATRDVARDILTDEGHAVVEAAYGMDGIELLQSNAEPMVVVLDYRLPDISGHDVLDIIAHDAVLRARHALIILSDSPHLTGEDCGQTLNELAVAVLPKPFDIDELLVAIRRAEQRLEPPEPLEPAS